MDVHFELCAQLLGAPHEPCRAMHYIAGVEVRTFGGQRLEHFDIGVAMHYAEMAEVNAVFGGLLRMASDGERLREQGRPAGEVNLGNLPFRMAAIGMMKDEDEPVDVAGGQYPGYRCWRWLSAIRC